MAVPGWRLRGVPGIRQPHQCAGYRRHSQRGRWLQPRFNFTYMINPENIGIELLLALPFGYDITLSGLGTVAHTDPATPDAERAVSFRTYNSVRPYVVLLLNYTTFFNEDTEGALTGTNLSLDDSWGVAGQVGVDIDVALTGS
ncbi:MAG: OmpW family outer membrane protein [Candidatus Competibacteraceae bacterium]